jgi:hypothetical protein
LYGEIPVSEELVRVYIENETWPTKRIWEVQMFMLKLDYIGIWYRRDVEILKCADGSMLTREYHIT